MLLVEVEGCVRVVLPGVAPGIKEEEDGAPA